MVNDKAKKIASMKITDSSSEIFLQCLSKLTTLNLVCLDNMQKLQFAEWQISDFWLGCHMRLYVETPAHIIQISFIIC